MRTFYWVAYVGPCKTSMMEFFSALRILLKVAVYFAKNLQHKFLTGSELFPWMRIIFNNLLATYERHLIQQNGSCFQNSHLHDLSRLHKGFNKHQWLIYHIYHNIYHNKVIKDFTATYTNVPASQVSCC